MSASAGTILVVDDEVDTCNNLSDILTDLGYTVDMAHDGLTALAKARARAYDVALVDLKMPGMDGLELCRELRRIRAGSVAIIVTAFADRLGPDEALDAGAWRVLAKPVDVTRLLPLVGAALEQPLVMVVDDDHDLCANLYDLLRDRGFRVGLAHDEAEAAQRLHDQAFKIVLIDLKLTEPGDGATVFRAVRAAQPEARTVVITGFRAELDVIVQAVLAEGADAVCYKPFDVPQLLATLERLSKKDEG